VTLDCSGITQHSGANLFGLTLIATCVHCVEKSAEFVDVVTRGRYGEQRTLKVKLILFDDV
jgi:hypothetical protein